MANQGDRNRVEPGIPGTHTGDIAAEPGMAQGTNAGLLSSSGTPITTDTGESTGGITGRVSRVVDSGKSKLAGSIHDLGDRMEHRGRDLESSNFMVRPVGRALDSTGNALESGARYLRTTEVGVIGDDVVDGIRSHPFLSAGLAMGAGLLLGRMFGGSDEEEEEEEREERDEDEREDEEREEDRSMMGRLRGKMGDVVAGGIASFAARKVRDRIAGR